MTTIKMKITTLNLDEDYYRALRRIALDKDLTVSYIINRLIREYVTEVDPHGALEGQTVPIRPFVMNEPEPEPELLGDPDFIPTQPVTPKKSFAVAEKPIPNPTLPDLKGVKVRWKGKEYVFPQKEIDVLLSTGQIEQSDVIG